MKLVDVLGTIVWWGFWVALAWVLCEQNLKRLLSDATELEELENSESEKSSPQKTAQAHTNRRTADIAGKEIERRQTLASRAKSTDAQLAMDFDDRDARLAAEHEEYSQAMPVE